MRVWGREVFELQQDSVIAHYVNESEFSRPQNFLVLFSYKKNSPADIKQDKKSLTFRWNSEITEKFYTIFFFTTPKKHGIKSSVRTVERTIP